MIDAGYFVRHVESRPEWLQALGVLEICSASNCISEPPEDWVQHWLHNELGWFDRAADALSVVPADQKTTYRLFAYRLHLEFYRKGEPLPFTSPDVRADPIPAIFRSLGFDSVSKSMASILGFECSPLSCNAMAAECDVNRFCLFPSLQAATAGAKKFSLEQPEPGDYYIVEVLEADAELPFLPLAAAETSGSPHTER